MLSLLSGHYVTAKTRYTQSHEDKERAHTFDAMDIPLPNFFGHHRFPGNGICFPLFV